MKSAQIYTNKKNDVNKKMYTGEKKNARLLCERSRRNLSERNRDRNRKKTVIKPKKNGEREKKIMLSSDAQVNNFIHLSFVFLF